MTIPPGVVRDLELLSRNLADPGGATVPVDLVATVTAIETSAADSVASYLGLRLLLHPPSSPDGAPTAPLTISTLPDPVRDGAAAGSSLLVPLPPPGSVGGPTEQGSGPPPWRVDIVLHAASPGAFVDLAADMAWLVGTPLDQVEVDRHTTADGTDGRWGPDGHGAPRAGSVAAASAVDQALGVLLAEGLTPEEATAELVRRSVSAGCDLATAAEHLLSQL